MTAPCTCLSNIIDWWYSVDVSPIPNSAGKDFDDSVIIIGSGAAGLFAGYTLSYLGIPFKILEARSTFGGRIQRTETFADVPLDIGAEWIHMNPVILEDLLLFDDTVDMETIDYRPRTYSFWKKGNALA